MSFRFELNLRRVSLWFALLAVAAVAIGCGSAGGDPVTSEPSGSVTEPAVGAFSISGIVVDALGNPLPGVSMSLTGGATSTTTTGPDGSYAFSGLGKGNYTVQPVLSGCNFAPANAAFHNLTASTSANFGGSGTSCGGALSNSGAMSGKLTISGKVTDSLGNDVPGVRITLSGSVLAIRTTTATGTYSFQVNAGIYTITPSGSCTYNPRLVSLGRITSTSKQQNFVRSGCSLPDAGTSDSGSDAKTDASDTGTSDAVTTDTGANDTGTDTGNADAGDAAADVCVPTSCAAANVVCGSLSDGCGSTLQCGSCAAGQSCVGGQCICQPATTCPSGQTCGTAPDGCGGTLNCGTCAAPQTCGGGGTPNQCGCMPGMTCAPGQNCGTAPDGCGGTINCGTCAAPETCGGGGTPNQCGCTPVTTCPAGQNCNTAPDGCGGTIDCGTCTAPETCGGGGTPNQCAVPPPTGCDLNTVACLTSRDKAGDPDTIRCSQCAIDNGCLDTTQMGGSCEDTTGVASGCASVLGTQSSPTETQVCLETLKDMFASQCAAGMQLTPCLCGTTDSSDCLAGNVVPNGPLYSVYSCDFRSSSAPVIQGNFTNQTFGAGQANALAQCLGSFSCDCF